MKSLINEKLCPQCGLRRMKSWDELDFEQKMLAEKLPASAEFSRPERKKHLFCINCWREETEAVNLA